MRINKLSFLVLLSFFTLHAQKDSTDSKTSVQLSKEIISPTTMLWQLQLEEKWVMKYEDQEGQGSKFRLRLIVPVEKSKKIPVKQLLRFITYLNTNPGGEWGITNSTWNQFFILGEKKWGDWGLGYNVQIPTAKNDNFGSKQWAIGPAFTVTVKHLGNWEMYYILQNFFSISNNSKYGKTANMVFQPNIFYTWSNGIYMGFEPLWTYDFENEAFDLPMNWRLGYIFRSEKFKYNTYIEPEWKMYRSDDFLGNNEQFAIKFGFRIFLPE